MTNQSSGNRATLLRELESQLKDQGIDGLPESWFEGLDEEESTSTNLQSSSLGVLERYQAMKAEAMKCENCRLHLTRKNVVFGVGNIENPPIAFVGEAPGADEDRTGEPLVGKAGELLTAAIEKGLRMSREQVYICNTIKCRPPENRNPMDDEIAQCSSFLERQLELVSPKLIVTLGSPAFKSLTGLSTGITESRGNWQQWRDIPLMPTFHPAYILRNPSAKREFWEDLQAVITKLGQS